MSVNSPSYWPQHLPRHLPVPATNLYFNVEVSAARYPDKPFIIFYDTPVTFAEFKDETERIAGFLQQRCGVKAGDRVLLYMQNSPQWVLAYYGILRANAVVVPVNPMNMTDELRHYVEDSGAHTAFVAQDLYGRIAPLAGASDGQLANIIVATYSDYLKQPSRIEPPEFVRAPRSIADSRVVHWTDLLGAQLAPGPLTAGADDLCVMPYTSGTTGKPKGCMHTHRSVMSTAVGYVNWLGGTPSAVLLSALPLFHVTGMQSGMNAPLFSGATIVVLPRWDRDAAARAIAYHRVTEWHSISTMAVDFLSNPRLSDYDLSSLRVMSGGGAAMPDAVARKLHDMTGITYIEGYGMSETIAPTHINPPQRPKSQCLGIPIFGVDSRIVDPATLEEVPQGEIGEIVTHGPQLMQGYWGSPEATREAFVEIDGKRFLRSGDLARKDEDGYFFMVDRLKRMINASGYKVWPAEVETMMYSHPAIREVCVIAARDEHRGETVKAFVVLHAKHADAVTEQDIVTWARENMAAYKAPRIVEFVESLPKSGSGKIMWRLLQDQEAAKSAA
ncbi:long-chain fatty acid--CoA ligase [Burkholderia multivorans]|uniref:long-chain fatty acid--CoA ligase n=1 Tax=Burkholderia multivorans TaxID=87883 RepID=UPI000D008477|nr:long-chain fatty acid--CoA ligase [Burkholderia multivorans]AYZ00708.1 long-chain fatty acid--CoA ligase [Burkholderia multivorans]MBU9121307.1 long-chain fatty acid--CoA ligase [Burkholderia multivorans]PRG52915.1 long-chain fatty acid--CoA ligase [Burkholderia multivorans]